VDITGLKNVEDASITVADIGNDET
jgi:hypothetical protein